VVCGEHLLQAISFFSAEASTTALCGTSADPASRPGDRGNSKKIFPSVEVSTGAVKIAVAC
jgi:hypothetical protein